MILLSHITSFGSKIKLFFMLKNSFACVKCRAPIYNERKLSGRLTSAKFTVRKL